jgi:hypothetical protein
MAVKNLEYISFIDNILITHLDFSDKPHNDYTKSIDEIRG